MYVAAFVDGGVTFLISGKIFWLLINTKGSRQSPEPDLGENRSLKSIGVEFKRRTVV